MTGTVEHPRRPVRLVGGELEAWPDARASDCIVWFPVPDAVEGGGGPEAEGVPAIRLGDARARLTGIPFFPYDVGLGDEVRVRARGGTLYCVDVIVATSDLVVRIFDEAGAVSPEQALVDPGSDEPFWRRARALAAHDVWFERHSSSYAAVLVPCAEWEYVRPYLELMARVEGLRWELATPLRMP